MDTIIKLPYTLYLLATVFILSSCNDDNGPEVSAEIKNLEKVTIQSGLTGTLKEISGNCMPLTNDGNPINPCIKKTIQDTIVIHALTAMDQLIGDGVFYDSVKSAKVATAISDQEGFYEVALDKGEYSIFILHDGKFFANTSSSNSINPVQVGEDSLTVFHPLLDLAVY